MTLAELVLAYDAKYPPIEKDADMLVDAKDWAAFVRVARAEAAQLKARPTRPASTPPKAKA